MHAPRCINNKNMTSSKEIEHDSHSMNNQPAVCPAAVEPKPAISDTNWLGMKARMAGNACLAALAQPATGPVLIACVCLATLAYNKRNRARTFFQRTETAPVVAPVVSPVVAPLEAPVVAKKPTVLHRSLSMAFLHGGKAALERFLDAQEARIDVEGLDGMVEKMKGKIPTDPNHRIDFKELYRVAMKLEMTGREDEAIEVIKEELVKAQNNKHSHEAYELGMLLVEMLLCKGDYNMALLLCKCLKEEEISDARVPLYLAVIYTMKDDKTYAEKYYKEFQTIRESFHCSDGIEEGTRLYGIVHNFEEFKEIVKKLKKEIEHAHKLKKAK